MVAMVGAEHQIIPTGPGVEVSELATTRLMAVLRAEVRVMLASGLTSVVKPTIPAEAALTAGTDAVVAEEMEHRESRDGLMMAVEDMDTVGALRAPQTCLVCTLVAEEVAEAVVAAGVVDQEEA